MATRKSKGEDLTFAPPKGGKMPRLVILGRGQLHGRKLHAIRIRPQVIEALASVASGPVYLLVEIAVNRLVEELQKRETIEFVRAEELG